MMVRQGDVLVWDGDKKLEPAAPVSNDKANRVILAEGEHTGHAHALDGEAAKLFETAVANTRKLVVTAPVALKHEEHAPFSFTPGEYNVRRQREYEEGAITNVAD